MCGRVHTYEGLPPLLYLATLAPLIPFSSSLVLLLPFLVRRFFAQHPYSSTKRRAISWFLTSLDRISHTTIPKL